MRPWFNSRRVWGPGSMKRLLFWLGASLAALLTLLFGLALWYRQASLPVYGGTFHVDGLTAPLRIERDAHAIARIVGRSEADVLFGLGYAHAQDRLWQMDFNRRLAQGRLAELVGSAGLEADRFVRTLGLARSAQALLDAMDAETRALLEAYVAGINAARVTRRGPLPPEFILTRAPSPAPWSALDSMSFAMLMALELSGEWRDELLRLRLSARFTLAEINDLRPPPTDEPVLPTADYPAQYRVLGLFGARGGADGRSQARSASRVALPEDAGQPEWLPSGVGAAAAIGSNSWVVAGHRSATGRPYVATDPHLALATPAVWYFARLDAPDLKVAGATLPGLPWVVLGRNAQVAWGATAVHGDGSDLYLERLHPTDRERYQTPDGYERFELQRESIRVRGGEDVELIVRRTRHGPVLSGVLGPRDPLPPEGDYALALRWGAAEPGDRTLAALRAMNRAQSAAELRSALAGWTLSQQHFLFADHRSIGLQVAGRFPLRGPAHDFAGQAPAPGWDPRYDWVGFVPPGQLPSRVDPPLGMIATANHNALANEAPRLGHDFALPFRARRIEQLLAARQRHDLGSMQAIQHDLRSLAARALVDTAGAVRPQTPAGQVAWARLAAWDGTMAVDAPEPLLLHAWMRNLRRAIFADDLGELAPALVERSEMTQALLNVLGGQAQARPWCDRRDSARIETCAELAAETLDATVAELAAASGRDVLGLRWGDAHVATLEHRPLSGAVLLRGLFEHSAAVGGDSHSPAVAALSLAPQAPFSSRHGAGARLVLDLSQTLDQGGGSWILSTGQSGHPASDHYGDQFALWRRSRQLPMAGSYATERTLLLKPARRR